MIDTPPSQRSRSTFESAEHKRRRCNHLLEQAGAALTDFKELSGEPLDPYGQKTFGEETASSSNRDWMRLGAAFTELAAALGIVVHAMKKGE